MFKAKEIDNFVSSINGGQLLKAKRKDVKMMKTFHSAGQHAALLGSRFLVPLVLTRIMDQLGQLSNNYLLLQVITRHLRRRSCSCSSVRDE